MEGAMTRKTYLVFSVVAYCVFFATFLYLIAFVGDFEIAPQTVNRGPTVPIPVAIAIDLGLIALFGLQHSIMARKSFKTAWLRVVPAPLERTIYVVASSVVLMLLFLFWKPVAIPVWEVDNAVGRTLLWGLFALGWGIVLLSTFLINHFELFGLRQVWSFTRGRAIPDPQFRQPMLYKMVRHPLYSGFVLAFWATPDMSIGHLLLAIGMTIYVLIAIGYEERDLISLFGTRYEEYRMQVGKLVPRIGRRRT
jgi:methanethiol S-methyltransferase